MNKTQAKNIAKAMVKKGVSGYGGRYQIAELIKVPASKITPTALGKVMEQFYRQVISSKKYPAIQVMFAEEKLRGINARRKSEGKGS